jgi:hypothetical protein
MIKIATKILDELGRLIRLLRAGGSYGLFSEVFLCANEWDLFDKCTNFRSLGNRWVWSQRRSILQVLVIFLNPNKSIRAAVLAFWLA